MFLSLNAFVCICYFQTSTNVSNLRASMVRAVTWLGRSNVAAILVGQEHCVTLVHVYTEHNTTAS